MGKKIFIGFLVFILEFIFTTSFLVPSVQAQNCSRMFTDPPKLIENVPPLTTSVPDDQRWVAFIIEPNDKSATYKLVWEAQSLIGLGSREADNLKWDPNVKALVDSGGGIPALKYPSSFLTPTTHKYYIEKKGIPDKYCTASYTIKKDTSGGTKDCTLNFKPTNPDETKSIELSGNISPQGDYWVKIGSKASQRINLDPNGSMSVINLGQFNPGSYTIIIQKAITDCSSGNCVVITIDTNCFATLNIAKVGEQGSITPGATPGPGGGGPPAKIKICIPNDPSCTAAKGLPCDPGKPAIKTAIGCIHTNPGDLIEDVLKFAIGIGGGLAFLMMLLGAFQMLTSAGNPETLQAGRDRLTSAVIGLLFVIFAVLLLQIIGVDILGIPGFGR